jgi:superfamily II DNA or RNA helicase
MPIKDFMEQGWLAPYQYYSVPINSSLCKDINSIRDFGIDGDYKTSVLEEVVDTSRIRAQLLDSYFQFVEGKKGIIYSISRLHSKHICQQYRAAGIKIADIDSETPSAIRKRLVQDFKNGDLDIIVNVDIFSEGFDCPDLEFVQLARPTRSLVKYIQQVGRGLRKNGDKQCLILDNVGMYGRFGLPDDDRPWEEYFIGNPQAESSKPSHESNPSIVNSGNFREADLREGVEEMTLIQSVSVSFMPENNEVSQNQLGTSIEEPIVTNEIMSAVVFAKYKIYENADGYGIYNTKTGERQFLSGSQSRQSISIKLLKTSDQPKKYTLVSSSNRDSHVSPNDRVIGFLFKDGRALRFESQNIDSVINIRI